ncbi:MAG: hypothetical protein AB8F95_15320, partial [Bacteroidia bacterium]
FNMSEFELGKLQVPYFSFEREKKTWFGLSRKTVSDLLILPNEGFFYPYTYGHYFYLYTKQKIEKAAFENWIHSTFPNKYADFDYTYAGLNKGEIELMHKDDYLIITNHDFQDGFGVIGGSQILNTLIERLRRMELKAFDEEIEE